MTRTGLMFHALPLEVAIAQVAHEANRAYCETLGDASQASWHDAPDWQRDSAIKGVFFLMRHPEATPADTHESWLAEKRADGWVYGVTKDQTFRRHPCMVPYELLPIEQRTKDALYQGVVKALLAPHAEAIAERLAELSAPASEIVGYQIAEEAATGKSFVASVTAGEADRRYDPNNWFPNEAAAQAAIAAATTPDVEAIGVDLAQPGSERTVVVQQDSPGVVTITEIPAPATPEPSTPDPEQLQQAADAGGEALDQGPASAPTAVAVTDPAPAPVTTPPPASAPTADGPVDEAPAHE